MKTRIVILVIIALFISGCNKKSPKTQEKIVKPPKEATLEDFVTDAAKFVEEKGFLKKKESKLINTEGYSIKGEDSLVKVVRFVPFKEFWKYDDLKPILKENPLSVRVIFKSGRSLKIEDYEDFCDNYSAEEDYVYQVDPRPKYIVYAGDKAILIGQDGKVWRSHEKIKSEKEQGEFHPLNFISINYFA